MFLQITSAVEPLAPKTIQIEHRKCFGLHLTMTIEKYFGLIGHYQ